jgi:glutamyl-tRNA reductase
LPSRQNKNELLVIDISNPRNVEEALKELPGVALFSIDDLTSIAEQNKLERQKSMQEAVKIVDDELEVLERAVKGNSVSEVISELLSQVEQSRQRELSKALGMMDSVDERKRRIINALTSSLLKQTFLPVIENFRKAAENNDRALLEVATRLFATNQS